MDRIGTAGWGISRPVADRFPSEGSVLERYAAVFPAVEINSSFYRPHQRKTYERWATSTPEDFRFAVKAPRTVTHDQRLRDADAPLARFFNEIAGLGAKLGAVLIQLPPSLAFDAEVGSFIAGWQKRFDGPTVIEPRHKSWFVPAVDEQLTAVRIARVAADPAVVPEAGEPGGWRGVTYLRLHGSPAMYDSAYDDAALAQAEAMLATRPAGTEGWCIFDNTRLGAATPDALRLLARPHASAVAGVETTAAGGGPMTIQT